jgi:hypothetical protein
MLKKILATVGVLSCVGLIYMLNSTTPATTGAFGVLAVFFLSYIVLVTIASFFIFWTYGLIKRVFYSEAGAVYNPVEFSFKRAYYFASVLSLGPVLLVSLKSVGKAGAIEALLVLFLLILGCIYVSRQSS